MPTDRNANDVLRLRRNAQRTANGDVTDDIKVKATGGIEKTTTGLAVKLDGASLSLSAAGLKIGALTTKGDILAFSTVPIRLAVGSDGQALLADSTAATGLKWGNVVTSVGLSLPAMFTVSGTPVTTTGTLTATLATQTANLIFAGPTTGAAASPTFRSLVAADLGTGTADATKFLRGDLTWATVTSGTVTSVGLSLPAIFTVSGTPVTGSGTLTATLATQAANLIYAGPGTGAAAAPTFRSLVLADVPQFTSTIISQSSAISAYPLNVGANTATATTVGMGFYAGSTSTTDLPSMAITCNNVQSLTASAATLSIWGQTATVNRSTALVTLVQFVATTKTMSFASGSTIDNSAGTLKIANMTVTGGTSTYAGTNTFTTAPTFSAGAKTINLGATANLGCLVFANTASSTQLSNFTGPTAFDVTASIPANTLTAGKVLRVTVKFQYQNTGTPSLTLTGRIGGVAVASLTVALTDTAAKRAMVSYYLTIRTAGASGTTSSSGFASAETASLTASYLSVGQTSATATGAIDTTAANVIDFQAQYSAASASNTIILRDLIVEALN